MILVMWLIPLVVSAASVQGDNMITFEPEVVQPSEFRIRIGDSVRAVTWDDLSVRPSQPVHVRLACIVLLPLGAPGTCISASRLAPVRGKVDWDKLRETERIDRLARPAAFELERIAEERIDSIRLPASGGAQNLFATRMFEETISPSDERTAFVNGPALTLRDVTLVKPFDPEAMRFLFPATAMRYNVNSRVSLSCRVETTLTLLCRDRGMIQLGSNVPDSVDAAVRHELLFSTYQLAATAKLAAKTIDGQDVVGRNLSIAIRWEIPQN